MKFVIGIYSVVAYTVTQWFKSNNKDLLKNPKIYEKCNENRGSHREAQMTISSKLYGGSNIWESKRYL